MSGTSLDGIDLAEVNFSLLNNRTWDYKILNTENEKIFFDNLHRVIELEFTGGEPFFSKENKDYFDKFLFNIFFCSIFPVILLPVIYP